MLGKISQATSGKQSLGFLCRGLETCENDGCCSWSQLVKQEATSEWELGGTCTTPPRAYSFLVESGASSTRQWKGSVPYLPWSETWDAVMVTVCPANALQSEGSGWAVFWNCWSYGAVEAIIDSWNGWGWKRPARSSQLFFLLLEKTESEPKEAIILRHMLSLDVMENWISLTSVESTTNVWFHCRFHLYLSKLTAQYGTFSPSVFTGSCF